MKNLYLTLFACLVLAAGCEGLPTDETGTDDTPQEEVSRPDGSDLELPDILFSSGNLPFDVAIDSTGVPTFQYPSIAYDEVAALFCKYSSWALVEYVLLTDSSMVLRDLYVPVEGGIAAESYEFHEDGTFILTYWSTSEPPFNYHHATWNWAYYGGKYNLIFLNLRHLYSEIEKMWNIVYFKENMIILTTTEPYLDKYMKQLRDNISTCMLVALPIGVANRFTHDDFDYTGLLYAGDPWAAL